MTSHGPNKHEWHLLGQVRQEAKAYFSPSTQV